MDWNYFKYIEAIALTGSLSKAAKLLRIDNSTLSRQLQKLENDYHVRIFKRDGNRYVTTEVGKQWVRCSQLARAHMDELMFTSGRQPCLVVTSLEMFINHYLIKRISHFKGKIEFIGADRSLDLARREADIAIRFGRPKSGDYLVQKLFTVGYSIYVRKDSRAELPRDWRECPWVTLNDEFENIEDARWFREHGREENITYKASSSEQILTLIQNTPVVGVLPCYMGDPQAELTRFEPGPPVFERSGWLVVHRELSTQKHACDFINQLRKLVKQDEKILVGSQ